ncbi:gluconate operon transcriptional repressor GntR [Paenibacillus sp. JCM 10914]|uniref:GntR family transcriptional regulator n=1 Tax=Paenibacillus sp. JCM 10914 TaxID=1236974 RepID=UPI0003CC5252|nr:GntR family transcriptional regulator [Paenibacillus sp. JCM 10914]GAE06157.1 gluconate operon transcriptional repressor [Paenibacillus sp. JCM 10914]
MKNPETWLRGTSLGEGIAHELRLQIISGVIPIGDTLSENRIASEFGISRSPVREALRTLASEGLIELERMGARVIGLSLKEVEELYDVRYLIESFVQQHVFAQDQSELITNLRQTVERMELAYKHHDPVEFAHQDLIFHESIITEANHRRILHLWRSIRPIVSTVMLITTKQIFLGGVTAVQHVMEKHLQFIQEMESYDASRILSATEHYFNDSRQTLYLSFGKKV